MSFATWVTADVACAHLGITTPTLARWIDAGLPCHQVHRRGRRLFDLAEIDQWVATRTARVA